MTLDALDPDDYRPSPKLACDLRYQTVPGWLRTTCTHRLDDIGRRIEAGRKDLEWQIYTRMAIEVSGLPPLTRPILVVLIDRDASGTVTDMSAGDIAERTGIARETVARLLRRLEAWGWLAIVGGPGKVPRITVTVPVETPPDRLRHPPAPPPPVTSGHTPPVTSGHKPVTSGHSTCDERSQHRSREQGAEEGADVVPLRDAVPRGAAARRQAEEQAAVSRRIADNVRAMWGAQQ